jgi:hypothetical protein
MKRSIVLLILMGMLVPAFSQINEGEIYSPVAGIFLYYKGAFPNGAPATKQLHYTRYAGTDRVKKIDYYYDGKGFLKLSNKTMIASTPGSDGILHHPDGDLLIAGQGDRVFKVNKATGAYTTFRVVGSDNYHLMMDPDNIHLWSSGIPGPPTKWPLYNSLPNNMGVGTVYPVSGSESQVTQISWDDNGTAFYTSSDYRGNGYFGIIDMNTMVTTRINPWRPSDNKGINDRVPAAHGMHFDSYSGTLLLFGNDHITQIDPITRKIIADLDFSTMGFNNIRFDQGTSDGQGHLFVADNNGYVIFVDYSSNPLKRIDDDMFIHAQWLDNELDDIAPLEGVGSIPETPTQQSSSSSVVVQSSSSSYNDNLSFSQSSSSVHISSSNQQSSSSEGGILISAGSSGGTSSSSDGGIGLSSSGISSSNIGGSSGGQSSSSDGGIFISGTSSTINNSSSQSGNSSSNLTSSSDGGIGISSGGTGTSSSSNGGILISGTSSTINNSSSDGGIGISFGNQSSSSSNRYEIEYSLGFGTPVIEYPSDTLRELGNKLVIDGFILTPENQNPSGKIEILQNYYSHPNTQRTPEPDLSDTTGLEVDVPLNNLIELELDMDRLRNYFGLISNNLSITATPGVYLYNPNDPSSPPADFANLDLTAATGTIWVAADTEINGAHIFFTSLDGRQLQYGNINFYDPLPEPEISISKDTDGDNMRDAIEVFFGGDISGFEVVSAVLRKNDDLYNIPGASISGSSVQLTGIDSILAAAENSHPTDYIPSQPDMIILVLKDASGVEYTREIPFSEIEQDVISEVVFLEGSAPGVPDSLYVAFNMEVTDLDLLDMGSKLLFNGQEFNVIRAVLSDKNVVLLEVSGINPSGNSVLSLKPGASFENMPFIVKEEFDREIPVATMERLPALSDNNGYYDSNSDGVMDSIAVRFEQPLTADQIPFLNFTFPWYLESNRIVYLQPGSSDLIWNPEDPNVVSWKVPAGTNLKQGLTRVNPAVAAASLFISYPILEMNVVEQRTIAMLDNISPVILDAKILVTGDDFDTLYISFSEPINADAIGDGVLFIYNDGKVDRNLPVVDLIWNADRTQLKVVVRHDEYSVLPGDIIRLAGSNGSSSPIVDLSGNAPSDLNPGILVEGDLSRIVETIRRGEFQSDDPDLKTVAAVTMAFAPGHTRARDLEAEGQLGHLIELGQRFMPQLSEQVGEKNLDPEKVQVSYAVQYYDHLGQFVADTVVNIPCTHPEFEGNCLTSDKKIFIKWNFKSSNGRFVGTGVYISKLRLLVRYRGNELEEELIDRWGVRRKD